MLNFPRFDEKVLDLNDVKKLFNELYFKNLMESNISHVLHGVNEKVSFYLSSDNSEIYTDGEKIVIGLPKECVGVTYGEIYSIIKACVGHEAAHIRWSNFDMMNEYIKEISKRKLDRFVARSIFNIIEDGRIERLLCEELPGYAKYIQFFNLTIIRKDGNLDANSDVLSKIMNTILHLSILGVYPLNYKEVLGKREIDLIDNKVYPLILKGIVTNSLVTHKEVCLEILDLIKEYIPEQIPQDLEDELSVLSRESYVCNKSEVNEDSFDLEEKLESMLSLNNASANNVFDNKRGLDSKDLCSFIPSHIINSHSQLDFSPSKMDENTLVSILKDEINKEVAKAFEKAKKGNEKLKDNNYDNNYDNYYDGIDLNSINFNYSSEKQEPDFEFIYPNYKPSNPQSEFKMRIHGLRKVFEKILKNKEGYCKGQKRGRLDSSRLWRLGINDNSVFSKKNICDKVDYAIEILIDVSGSMKEGSKYKNAIGTAICLEAALTGLEGVEVKTVVFNYKNGTKMKVLKDFVDIKSKTPTVYDKSLASGCNRDGFAIRVALDDLKRHKAKNKLLIVISDGMPSCDVETKEESIADVKNAIYEGRKFSTIISILINNGKAPDYVKEVFDYMYDKKGTIMVDVRNNPEDLMKNIVFYLKRMFTK